jgi:hypothetical protein
MNVRMCVYLAVARRLLRGPAPPSDGAGSPLLSSAAKDAPRPGAPAGGWQSAVLPRGISSTPAAPPAPSAPAWDLPPSTVYQPMKLCNPNRE